MITITSSVVQESVDALSLMGQAIEAARPGSTHQLKVQWNIRRAQQLAQRLGIILARTEQDEKFFCETFYNPGGLEDFQKKKPSDIRKAIEVQEHIISDIESLYETSSNLIDIWASICCGLINISTETGFNVFVKSFIETGRSAASEIETRLVTQLRKNLFSDLCWLNNHIKIFRNKFVVHYTEPWQQSIHFNENEMRLSFELYLAFRPEEERDKFHQEVLVICGRGPEHLRVVNAESYPYARILSHCLDHIDEFEQSVRERLSQIARCTGFIGPTSQAIVDRSCQLLSQSVPILIALVNENTSLVNLV